MVPFTEELGMDCFEKLYGHWWHPKVISIQNVLPSKSGYKTLTFIKNILYYRRNLLFSVQMIQEQIRVILLIIYSCPTNIPCECRWFMNYSTIFDYMLLSGLWLTFTKQTAVLAKTLLSLLPPSQLFVTDPLPEILAPVPDTAKPAAPQLLQFII